MATPPAPRGIPIRQLVYLHGFRSSPLSTKARQTEAWMRERHPEVPWWCPQLPPSPAAAMGVLRERLDGASAAGTGVIGSSLGGYYATALAEALGCRAVLLNPAVDPARDLAAYIGEITAWHGDERFHFRAEFIDELRALDPGVLTQRERYHAIIAKGDEVLSWVEMSERYRGCTITLLEGSDHALSGYEAHLPAIEAFFGLARTG